jgi:Fanconi anemia group M protein
VKWIRRINAKKIQPISIYMASKKIEYHRRNGELGEQKKKYINNTLLPLKPNTVLHRKYQVDIFITCSKSNTLVVVPTGLGKTIIALLLSLHRLKIPDTKIIFLAPTRPLVEQHYRTFQNLTNLDTDSLIMMTGSLVPAKRELLYKESLTKCLFMTPQILQNDLISNRIALQDVSLIIFDEAHRASGAYAYTFLAKKYMQQSHYPKILAMTASPGKDRAKIEDVMQNLFLDAIEIRVESDPDVKPYIQDVETIWKDVELPQEMKEIHTAFKELQQKLYQELKKNEILDSANVQKVSRKTLLASSQALDGMIAKAQNTPDFPRLLYCKKIIANSIRVSHMSELVEAQGISSLKAYLDKNIQKIEDGQGGKSLRELFASTQMDQIMAQVDHLQTISVDHPKIAVLLDILNDQFTTQSDSRILIFCHFRDTVANIVKIVNQNSLIRAEQFIGQQKRGNQKGLTQKEQLALLDSFRAGDLNTLVATSVAEEGLDISECDVVIFYDVVPSEIRAIQRRGRTGRNQAGKVIILKTKGTREEGYFWAEKRREKEMKRVLREMKRDLSHSTKPKKTETGGLMAFLKPNSNQTTPPQSESPPNSSENFHLEIPEIPPEYDSKEIPLPAPLPPFPSVIDSPFIMVDSRETASSVARELSERNAQIKLLKLPVGDYIISERCGFERKSMQDFVDSVKDGRLFTELRALKNQFPIPILILEGNFNAIVSMHRAALLGALSSILLKMNIFLYQTGSPKETAEILIAFAKKEQQGKREKPFSIRFKKIPDNPAQKLEYILAGVPGINTARARDLLKEFRTLQQLFNASENQLQKVANIGPKLAATLHKFATLDYYIGQPAEPHPDQKSMKKTTHESDKKESSKN